MIDPSTASRGGSEPRGSQPGGIFAGYDSTRELPLGGYAALLGIYAACAGALLVAGRRRLPARFPVGDLVLLGVATHKLSRIITRDWVTGPIRAPFTHYEGSAGSGEVNEKARGTGLQRAVGDLLTCPWCIGPWVAGTLVAGYVAQPRAARVVAGVFTAVTLSDFLHQSYGAAKERAE